MWNPEWIKWKMQHFVNQCVWFSLATELTSFQGRDRALTALHTYKDIKTLCFGHFASLKNCKLPKEVTTKFHAKIVLLISWWSNFIEHLIIFINLYWLLGNTTTCELLSYVTRWVNYAKSRPHHCTTAAQPGSCSTWPGANAANTS